MIKNIHLMGYCLKFGSSRAQIKITWKHFETWRLLSYMMVWQSVIIVSEEDLEIEAACSPPNIDNDVPDRVTTVRTSNPTF